MKSWSSQIARDLARLQDHEPKKRVTTPPRRHQTPLCSGSLKLSTDPIRPIHPNIDPEGEVRVELYSDYAGPSSTPKN